MLKAISERSVEGQASRSDGRYLWHNFVHLCHDNRYSSPLSWWNDTSIKRIRTLLIITWSVILSRGSLITDYLPSNDALLHGRYGTCPLSHVILTIWLPLNAEFYGGYSAENDANTTVLTGVINHPGGQILRQYSRSCVFKHSSSARWYPLSQIQIE